MQDATTINLPDASVDLIVSNLGINNFDQPDAALRSCLRREAGANLFLTTNLVGHMSEFYDVYRNVLLELGFTDRLAAARRPHQPPRNRGVCKGDAGARRL